MLSTLVALSISQMVSPVCSLLGLETGNSHNLLYDAYEAREAAERRRCAAAATGVQPNEAAVGTSEWLAGILSCMRCDLPMECEHPRNDY